MTLSKQKNIYHLKNISLKSHGDSIEYPFDEYEEIIELNAINGANTKYIIKSLESCYYSKTTTYWHITVSAKGNCLYFTFTRNQEVSVFLLLIVIGIILIGLKLIYIYRVKKSKKKRLMNFILYLGRVISIPFYTGVIFNYIVYVAPQFLTKSLILLLFLTPFIIILDAYIFVIREKEKEKTITKLWKKRVKR